MDCAKFEDTLLDELYEELDEVTSAAMKRHAAGCTRCASLLSGMKATRKLAALPMVKPPEGLEERIFAATRQAQRVVPIRGRLSRMVSWAGSRAMEPQFAMAALFLIMLGTAGLLMKGSKMAKPPSSVVTVSDEGQPAAAEAPVARREAVAQTTPAPEPKAPAALASAAAPPPPAATPTTTAPSLAAPSDLASNDVPGSALDGVASRSSAPAGRVASAPAKPTAHAADREESLYALNDKDDARNASSVAGAPASPPPPPAMKYATPPPSRGLGGLAQSGGAGAGAGANAGPAFKDMPSSDAPAQQQAPVAAAAPAPKQDATQTVTPAAPSSVYQQAMRAYEAGDFVAARDLFDRAGATGDLHAQYKAAQSELRANGCSTAVRRFDRVMQAGVPSDDGYDAELAAGRCYRQLGDLATARARLFPLLTVTRSASDAQKELAQVAQASRSSGGGGGGYAKKAAPAAPAPAPTQQAPASQAAPKATSPNADSY